MGSASSVHRVLSLTCSEYAPSPTHPVQLMTKGTAPAPAATPAMPYLTWRSVWRPKTERRTPTANPSMGPSASNVPSEPSSTRTGNALWSTPPASLSTRTLEPALAATLGTKSVAIPASSATALIAETLSANPSSKTCASSAVFATSSTTLADAKKWALSASNTITLLELASPAIPASRWRLPYASRSKRTLLTSTARHGKTRSVRSVPSEPSSCPTAPAKLQTPSARPLILTVSALVVTTPLKCRTEAV